MLSNSTYNLIYTGYGDCVWAITSQENRKIRIIFEEYTLFYRSVLTIGTGEHVMADGTVIFIGGEPRAPKVIWIDSDHLWITVKSSHYSSFTLLLENYYLGNVYM